jgi:hypothetical protein
MLFVITLKRTDSTGRCNFFQIEMGSDFNIEFFTTLKALNYGV